MRKGGNETLERYIPWFKKVWQSIQSILDEIEICAIIKDSFVSIINLHAPSNKTIGFGALIQELLQKEKVLLEFGELKYAPNPFHNENRQTYAKKEDKIVHMIIAYFIKGRVIL